MILGNLTGALPIFTKSSRLPPLKSRSWSGGQKCRDRRGCARRKKSQTRQATISTFGEVFLRNHASPWGLLTGRKRKNAAGFLFPQAQPAAKPWSHESARPSVKWQEFHSSLTVTDILWHSRHHDLGDHQSWRGHMALSNPPAGIHA